MFSPLLAEKQMAGSECGRWAGVPTCNGFTSCPITSITSAAQWLLGG
ncbi:hypothetical protein CLOSTMETH_01596 [[Clostridium] methylpentosum DSM 5476]|uniref:Uncharacterized protein n=1 Tax=[Clostridium] methylpentosum DSM 5476 TaxID=537013 RepID=C0ECM5_9FIRM|nr:hypothetical protein CLOSTMETH_01596 [[Clostridium] methylpentosum DSM 5476]